MIKIDIISGFLGAGKTTLIQKLFKDSFAKEKIVLIENEFGEIGIDGAFLKEFGVDIKEINSGCICCSLVGDFSKSMEEVITRFNPDRIIIEPSGVGKLSDIKKAVIKVERDLKLNILATVVDGSKAKMHIRNFGEFFNDQVSEANTIVVTRLDKINEEKLDDVVKAIRELNKDANIITTPVDKLDGTKILETLESNVSLSKKMFSELEEEHHEHECCHGHHHHEEEHECCCGHHHHEEEHECCCGHHHEEEHECCCGHHHHEEEHECCHGHHHHEEEHECCHGHHHHEEEHECCSGHHHHEEEHECCHEHHHNEEGHECCCGHHHEEEHECGCGHHHHHHHDADEVFTSWGQETVKSFTREKLEACLEALANREDIGVILRSKGILKASDNDSWYYFDFVSGDYEIRLGSQDIIGRLCVIGSKIDEEKIKEIFGLN